MTLNQPIDYISIDFAGGWNLNNEIGYLDAFDINLNLLDRYITSPLQYGDVETMSVAGANIAFAVAYIPPGLGSFGRLDNLSLHVVPEPSVEPAMQPSAPPETSAPAMQPATTEPDMQPSAPTIQPTEPAIQPTMQPTEPTMQPATTEPEEKSSIWTKLKNFTL